MYLPVTTEIASLPQLAPEGLPLALARRAAEEARMARAVADLVERGEPLTSRALAAAAHISREHRLHLARDRWKRARLVTDPTLSVLHYTAHRTSDNAPVADHGACTEAPEQAPAPVEPLPAAPAPPKGKPLLPVIPAICPAASHRLRLSVARWILAVSSVRRIEPQERRSSGS